MHKVVREIIGSFILMSIWLMSPAINWKYIPWGTNGSMQTFGVAFTANTVLIIICISRPLIRTGLLIRFSSAFLSIYIYFMIAVELLFWSIYGLDHTILYRIAMGLKIGAFFAFIATAAYFMAGSWMTPRKETNGFLGAITQICARSKSKCNRA